MKVKKFSIWNYVFKHSISYLFGVALLLMVDLLTLRIPKYRGLIFDGLYGGNSLESILLIIKEMLIVYFLMAICRFAWRILIIGSSKKIDYEIRRDMFKHIETLGANYFNLHKTGDLMAYFTNDLEAIKEATGWGVVSTVDAITLTVLTLIKMVLYVDFKLTALVFIPMFFIAVSCTYFGSKIEDAMEKKQEAFSKLSDKVQESITGIRVIKAFVKEQKDLLSFESVNEESKNANIKAVKLRATFFTIIDFLIGLSMLINIFIGGKMVIEAKITPGQFIEFNSYIGILVWPMIDAGDSLNTFSLASAASKRIDSILKVEREIKEDENPYKEHIKGEIEFNNLSFRYQNTDRDVLKNINLKVKQGETLAILGRTGSGKTTLSDLLVRVYDVQSDMIKIDGISIDKYSLDILHNDIAYVPQDSFLFSDTLEENIAFGLNERIKDDEAIKDKIIEASKISEIHDNIVEFPLAYKTIVGERGVTLSGGQKQRSSIARAILKDAPILILDDSLSAVDTDTEEKILNNLKKIRKDKTTIIIAHRISALQNADQIIVLDNGEIIEHGSHNELIKLDGFYANIYHKQQLEAQIGRM